MARTKRKPDEDTIEEHNKDIFFVGKVLPVLRMETGLWSLDRVCMGYKGEIGFPITTMEIYGPTNSGKSSFCYSVAAYLCGKAGKQMVLADLEGFNPDTLEDILRHQGYKGAIYLAEGKSPDIVLDDLVLKLQQDDVLAGILDSVAAISPVSELQSGVGEANMGRRAKMVTTEQRKVVNLARREHRLAMHINHALPTIGKMFSSVESPGGLGIHYLSAVRLYVWRKKKFSDGSFIMEGTVKKNRWGFIDRTFSVFFLMGYGLHPGMSAIWDCARAKLLYTKKGESTLRWKTTKEEIQPMMHYAGLARAGETEPFLPFFDALNAINTAPGDVSTNDESSPEDETETEV